MTDLRTCTTAEYVDAYAKDWQRPDHVEARKRGRKPLAREFAVASAVVQEGCESALDVGCGEGHLAALLAQHLMAAVGVVDCVAEAVSVAAAKVRAADPLALDFMSTGQAESVLASLPPACYEAVTCCEMVEHVQDPRALVGLLARVARKLVVITTPVGRSYDDPLHLHHWYDAESLDRALGLRATFSALHITQIPSQWGDTDRCWLVLGRK